MDLLPHYQHLKISSCFRVTCGPHHGALAYFVFVYSVATPRFPATGVEVLAGRHCKSRLKTWEVCVSLKPEFEPGPIDDS